MEYPWPTIESKVIDGEEQQRKAIEKEKETLATFDGGEHHAWPSPVDDTKVAFQFLGSISIVTELGILLSPAGTKSAVPAFHMMIYMC